MKRFLKFPPDNRLEVRELEGLRGSQCLFRDLSLTLEAGAGLQVKGANGCGKTTFLRTLCGLTLAESGTIRWNGTDIRHAVTEYHSKICYLGHKSALKDELTPAENLTAWMALQGRSPKRGHIAETLELVGIHPQHERPSRTLSAGQQQRVALARILLGDAPLWILDEPATALDGPGMGMLNGILQDHVHRGGLLIFSSHQRLLDSLSRQEIRLSETHD